MNIALWIVQGLLALGFAAAGARKLGLSRAALAQPGYALHMVPAPVVRVLGLAEVLGALGLILPAATKITPALTPATAAGLTLLLAGLTIFYAAQRNREHMVVTGVQLLLAAVVLIGRIVIVPIVG